MRTDPKTGRKLCDVPECPAVSADVTRVSFNGPFEIGDLCSAHVRAWNISPRIHAALHPSAKASGLDSDAQEEAVAPYYALFLDDCSRRATTDGKPARPGYEARGAPAPIDPATGQHEAYWVLSEEERGKGFVRPVRRAYRHAKCGAVTTMGLALCETYARKPTFYNATFCCSCGAHFPVAEFTWDGTTEAVGS